MQGSIFETLRRRWAQAGYPSYPVWLPLAMDGTAMTAAVVATAQRHGEHPLLPVTALALVAIAPWLVGFAAIRLSWPVFTLVTLSASTALMVAYPVEYDFAIFLLVMMVGHLGATEPLARSAAATALTGVVLLTLDQLGQFSGSKFWFAAMIVGWDVGFMMQWQQRRLEEEVQQRAARESRVALEERQRIAREIHDVVAHSLSVTMLHLTAARRDLEADDEPDVDEAVDALREAERIGRQAMVDIRRTVGLLGDSGSSTTPVPDLGDAAALVAQFRAAGLDVTMTQHLDGAVVPAPVGLATYRVLQESLANVAKHQPRAAVRVDLVADGDALGLTVVNDLPDGARRAEDGEGAGLRGMRERAELLGGTLSAGQEGGRWCVRLAMPIAGDEVPGADGASVQSEHCTPMRVLPRWAGEQP